MMHYFKRNIGDYHKKAGRLSMLEHGAYTLLMDSCYDRERFPTLNEAMEWVWARTTEEIEAVKFILSRFFTLVDGVYVQERIADEIAAFHGKSERNREIALKREEARRTKRARNVHDESTNGHLTTNHKPLTTNQENPPTPQEGEERATGSDKFDPFTACPANVSPLVWAEWVKCRREQRKPLKESTCKAQAKLLADHPNPDAVIQASINAGWQGLFPERLTAVTKQNGFKGPRPALSAGEFYHPMWDEGIRVVCHPNTHNEFGHLRSEQP